MTSEEMAKGLDDGTVGYVVMHVDIRGGGGWTATGNVIRDSERP